MVAGSKNGQRQAKRPRTVNDANSTNVGNAKTVLLLENIHTNAVEKFEAAGYNVVLEKGALSEEDLIKRLEGVVALGVRSKTKVTSEVLEAASDLLCTGNFCIGTDGVRLDVAEDLGIACFNAPFSNTRSVAELVLSHTIALSRRVFHVSSLMHEGDWLKSSKGCNEVRGKTMGVVGYGHVGSQVSVLAEAMGMNVIFFDTETKMPLGNAKAAKSLEDLLSEADIITLHVPKAEDTRNMITATQIAMMKKGAYLINYARGTVVDVDALADALKSGHLAGAAIDVFPSEPASNGPGFESPLVGCPNTILTPHIGGSTQEAQALIGVEVADKIIDYINTGCSATAKNIPRIGAMKRHADTSLLLNIHRNVPGVLSSINSILADVNVAGQQLRTTEKVGYLFVEVNGKVPDSVISSIQALDTSVRTRVIA